MEKKTSRRNKEISESEKEKDFLARHLVKLDKKIALLERDIEQCRAENNQLSLDLSNLMSRNEAIKQQATEEITMDAQSLKERIRQLEKLLDRMEGINQLALRDYEEIKQEYDDKETQRKEILDALKILEKSVRRIDRKSRTRFSATFKNINSKFSDVFAQLTNGGTAYLEEELSSENEEHKGIRIMASPRGRRKTTVSLLSGGEKTVVAIALIMAIFHLNPSPFCLMDEADAMLDDENIIQFNRMISNMSTEIQFILISHNKSTVRNAQHLIGVTMAEPGISQVVSVDMDRVVELSRQIEA